jgi:hypothetical protein
MASENVEQRMMSEQPSDHRPGSGILFDVRWGDVWSGYAVAAIVTAVLGTLVFLLDQNVWWVSVASMVALVVGGSVAGFRARQIEPLNGALLICVFFGTEAVILMLGTALEGTAIGLPDPLPGLAIGDSTFYFVSPLGQLASAVLGSVLGGWLAQRRLAPQPARGEALSSASDDDSSGGSDVPKV